MKLGKEITDALGATASVILGPLGIERDRIAAAIRAFAAVIEEREGEREPLDRIMKTAEVAALLKCTPQTIRALARRGAIRRVYFAGGGRASGFAESSVRAFLASGTKTPANAQNTGATETKEVK